MKTRGLGTFRGAVGATNNGELWFDARAGLGLSLWAWGSIRLTPSLGLGVDGLQSPDAQISPSVFGYASAQLSLPITAEGTLHGTFSRAFRGGPDETMDRLGLCFSLGRVSLFWSRSDYDLTRLNAVGLALELKQ